MRGHHTPARGCGVCLGNGAGPLHRPVHNSATRDDSHTALKATAIEAAAKSTGVVAAVDARVSRSRCGFNIFLYHHSKEPGAPILCDFGVEVTRVFDMAGEVYATETPRGDGVLCVEPVHLLQFR